MTSAVAFLLGAILGAAAPAADDVAALDALLRELPHVRAERRGDALVVTGWTRSAAERSTLDRVLKGRDAVVDLTTEDVADPARMIEIDVILVVVSDLASTSVGFDFLRLLDVRYDFFLADNSPGGIGVQAPGVIGPVSTATRTAHLFTAGVDYDVNLANAVREQVSVLARPHLTALNGERAEFLSGGEIVFQVNGIENGDIKPYPFGIKLDVTPTLLRTRGDDGEERVRVEVEAVRTSILGLQVLSDAAGDTDVRFDKTSVKSQAVLRMNETLVLSGLYQREYRERDAGTPWLGDVPGLGALFSNESEVDDVQSVVILLTPRDPARVDERRNEELERFIERRRAYVRARAEGGEAVDRFKEEYPDWYRPRPNRYASQMFLMTNSPIYRQVSGDDLRTDALESGLWVTDTAAEAREGRSGGGR